MMSSTAPNLYLNMQQFSELKLAARQDSAEASRAAAQQFEGLFVQMMLKNMRAAAVVDPSQHSSTMDFYSDMYDKQLSLMLSQQGGIGIADLIERQLNPQPSKRQQTAADAGNALPTYRLPQAIGSSTPAMKMDYVAINPQVKTHQLQPARTIETADAHSVSPLQSETLQPFYGWSNARSFISDLWPHAQQAANKLGVSADVIVAQSALETGWGQHAMKKPDGSLAFNLFGIKAGSDWAGQSVLQQTLEFRDGSMQQESARFRAYDSLAEALHDYVDFIQSSPRYAEALQHGGDDHHYISGLQRAGYATDPAYAHKIINIMQGQTFNKALATLTPNPRQLLS